MLDLASLCLISNENEAKFLIVYFRPLHSIGYGVFVGYSKAPYATNSRSCRVWRADRIHEFPFFVGYGFGASQFWPKVMLKNTNSFVYPSAKGRRRLKLDNLGVIFRGASACNVQMLVKTKKN